MTRLGFRGIRARRAALILAALALGSAPALAQTRSHRRRHRRRHAAAKPQAPSFHLPARRWDPGVRKVLERLVDDLGRGAPGYSQSQPPVAVFAWDGVAAVNSAGEAAFARLVTRAEFKFNDAFWDALPLPFGRRAKVGYQEFKDQPPTIWPQDPNYAMYRKALFAAHRDVCKREGPRACVSWTTRLLAGFTEEEVSSYMKTAVEEEERQPLGWDDVSESAGDERPVRAPRGLRPIPEMRDLIVALLDHGFDVWVFSTSNQWAAQAFAAGYGVHPTRVVGVRCRARNEVLQPEVLDPVPVGVNQAEALTMTVGRGPDLVVGGPEDLHLLEYGGGSGVRLAVDPGDGAFAATARAKRWLLQSSFIPKEARELK